MAHELTIDATGKAEMAFAAGITPWHQLGQEWSEDDTLDEKIRKAGMAWEVKRARVRFALDDKNPGKSLPFLGRDVLFRSDNNAPLSVVSHDYKVHQPREIFEYFEGLSQKAGFKLVTAGTLFGGRVFWAQADVGAEAHIANPQDKVKGRVLLSTSLDGSLSTSGRFISLCVVCNNTLQAGVAEKGGSVYKQSHRRKFSSVEMNKGLGIELEQSFSEQMAMFRKLAETPMTPADMVHATLEVYLPGQAEIDDKALVRVLHRRHIAHIAGSAIENKLIGGEIRGGGTAWTTLNAATQYIDWDNGSRSADQRFRRAQFGLGNGYKGKMLALLNLHAEGKPFHHHKFGLSNQTLVDEVLSAAHDKVTEDA